jgi:UDP-N-acetyl-2-amino-2-deoxyglucuronate dehydrogenase
LQNQDFLQAIIEDRESLVTGCQGRMTVEIFTVIYRSQRDRKPISFPAKADDGLNGYAGRTIR